MSENQKKNGRKIILYSHADCPPCKDIKKLVEKGDMDAGDVDELEIVDIDTDEGFDRFEKEVLSKLPADGEAQLPGAYVDGIPCGITMADDNLFVVFECPKKEPPAEVPPQ